jgi:2-iminobutanoate/2-iminopropanoate deaminase
MRVYLTDPSQFTEMNDVYSSFVQTPYPARTTVYVGLPAGMLVEIDALAVLED